ncbi:MAG: hypothetical protein ACLQU4_16230 [Limisphaerales bacterium]
MKSFISVVLALWAAALLPAAASAQTTQTNVLQNINLQLTIYQQGSTNSNGRKVADQVTSYTTKNLITALEAATGQSFGNGAKLVQSTLYSNITVNIAPIAFSTNFSTNLALATNSYLDVGGTPVYNIDANAGVVVISNGVFISGENGNIDTNVLSVVTAGVTTESVTFDTNVFTILTPSTDTNGIVTNVAVLNEQATSWTTESILTNSPSSIDILSGSANLYPINNYLSISPSSTEVVVETGASLESGAHSFSTNSAEVVVETGAGLNTTNAVLASQTGFSIQNLAINYFTPTGSTNLILNLQGFVKQALKLDTLAAKRGTNAAVVADIFGASSTWNVIGFGYAGGTYTNNPDSGSVPIFSGSLINPAPVVVEGSVSISFLKNLAQ